MAQAAVARGKAKLPRSTMIYLGLTVVTGLLLAVLLAFFLSSIQATTTVIRTTRDIPAHTVIQAQDVRPVAIPARGRPEGAITRVEDVVGKFALAPLVAGQTVLAGHVTDVNQDRSLLANQLTQVKDPQIRAFAVPVSGPNTFGGESGLKAGDRVDVIADLEVPAQDGSKVTFAQTILRSKLVLKVIGGSQDLVGQDDNQAVVLAVTNEEANLLAYAVDHGKIHLALVPYVAEDRPTEPVTPQTLFQRLNLRVEAAPTAAAGGGEGGQQ